jgi:hypothetical protein
MVNITILRPDPKATLIKAMPGGLVGLETRERNQAYSLTLHGKGEGRMADQDVQYILNPAWEKRELYRPRTGDTLRAYHSRLCELDDMGQFIAAQVVADMNFVEPLKNASDWMTFARSGPGSRRGIWRVHGRPIPNKPDWSPK